MDKIERREESLDYIKRYSGLWYKWGGDDPKGFDCSGLAIEFLKAAGLLPRKFDTTAQGLWERYQTHEVKEPSRGCLVFWHGGNKDKAIHVEIMLNSQQAIGASGGGSKTQTESDAMRDNAFIKVRTIKSRSGIKGFVDPFQSLM